MQYLRDISKESQKNDWHRNSHDGWKSF
jgi:hypothetical protein